MYKKALIPVSQPTRSGSEGKKVRRVKNYIDEY
jgi:hypothetical protein